MGRILIGCSGWYYEHWRGVFYPESMKKKDWLSYYSKFFKTVEINASFYMMPRESTLRRWYEMSPEDFTFSLKVYRGITHRRRIGEGMELLRRFYRLSKILGEKLCCVLFQFPPSFRRDIESLNKLMDMVDRDVRNVFEFRHPSWFKDDVAELLRENNISMCIVSAPKLPVFIRRTSEFYYIRWHGRDNWYGYEYGKEEIMEWAEVVKNLSRDGDVYGYFNNDFNCYAVKNGLELLSAIGDVSHET